MAQAALILVRRKLMMNKTKTPNKSLGEFLLEFIKARARIPAFKSEIVRATQQLKTGGGGVLSQDEIELALQALIESHHIAHLPTTDQYRITQKGSAFLISTPIHELGPANLPPERIMQLKKNPLNWRAVSVFNG